MKMKPLLPLNYTKTMILIDNNGLATLSLCTWNMVLHMNIHRLFN